MGIVASFIFIKLKQQRKH